MAATARRLPDLRSRVRIDSSDVEKTEKEVASLDKTLRKSGDATKPLETGLDRAFGAGTQRKMSDFGKDMTTKVTLPIAAGAAASVKMASDFATTFQQMIGLAGVPAAEIDDLKQSVLDLSHETAIGPQELAEALYQIESSGVPAAEAMDVLTASAKASAVGLGETAAVADAVTSAVNAYGAENITAARATDILFAAVREGKGEADALAPQLGRLLPVASQLGIEFEEVAGSVAFLTQKGNDAAGASTQLAGIMQKLLKPSQQAAEELAKVGLSADVLREVVAEDGLVGVIQLLNDRFAGNEEAIGKVLEDSEAITGFYALAANNASDYAETLDQVTQSQGVVNQAFDQMSETDEFAARQALADLLTAAIEVGQQLAPVLATIAGHVSAVVGAFNDLPDGAQGVIVALGLILAAIGPVVNTVSALNTALKAVKSAASAAGNGLEAIGANAVSATSAIVGVTAAVTLAVTEYQRWRAEGERLGQALADQGADQVENDIDKARSRVGDLVQMINDLDDAREASTAPWDFDYRQQLDSGVDALDREADALQRSIDLVEELSEATGLSTDELAEWATGQDIDLFEVLGDGTETVEGLTAKIEDATDEQGNFLDVQADTVPTAEEVTAAYQDQQDALNDLTDGVLDAIHAQDAYEDSLHALNDALNERKLFAQYAADHPDDAEAQERAREATEALEDAIWKVADAQVAAREKTALAHGETFTAEDRNAAYRAELLKLADQLDPDDPLRTNIAGFIDQLDKVDDTRTVDIETEAAHRKIAELRAVLDQFQNDYGGSIGVTSPGFANAERQGGDTEPRPVKAGRLAMPAPALAIPAAPTSVGFDGAPVVNVQVIGEPDAMTLDRLRRTAADAVSTGWSEATRVAVRKG